MAVRVNPRRIDAEKKDTHHSVVWGVNQRTDKGFALGGGEAGEGGEISNPSEDRHAEVTVTVTLTPRDST